MVKSLFLFTRHLNLSLAIFAFLLLTTATASYATHNRAGEIVYKRIEGFKFEIQIITYTEIGPSNADRPELGIDYGDGSGLDSISRTSKITPFLGRSDIQKNIYRTEHTFPGAGKYVISMLDPNRNGEVINIPNSIDEMFYIESTLNITLSNSNSTPILLNPPIDFACVGAPFIHSPGAWDPDGDSLVYSLVVSKGTGGQPIPGYSFPNASKFITIDPVTGILTWDSPIGVGEYNLAILITEYRRDITANGSINIYQVGSILRDMQVDVSGNCNNRPPTIYGLNDYCVMAGENLRYSVFATDTLDDNNGSGNGTKVETFLAYGGPFEIAPTANTLTKGVNPLELIIDWTTDCNHIQKSAYTVTYKATDNGTPKLSNYATNEILVVAPPVENVSATALTSFVLLEWEKQKCNDCIGYRIYRKLGPSGFVPDQCQTGVPPNIGYNLIYEGENINETSFQDDNDGNGLIPGEIYCYLIVSYFPDGAESYASEEVCTQLKKDVPILTNVNVMSTDLIDGEIEIAWSPPSEHDSILFPGPYSYKIYRTSTRKSQEFEIVGNTSDFLDTTFVDIGLNTQELEYMYKIEMLDLSTANEVSMGFSVAGTSIYLRSVAQDNKLILEWNELVPWRNYLYEIYRVEDSDPNNPVLIGETSKDRFTDTGLTNLRTYCYLIRSKGEYSLNSIAKPLFNWSQVHCNQPVDMQAPCPPDLALSAEDCDEVRNLVKENPDRCGGNDIIDRVDKVYLQWTNPNLACDSTDDVRHYELYFSPSYFGDYTLLHRIIDNPSETNFTHYQNNTRSGCYYITAIDSFDNASPVIDTVCIDNCRLYELPNVFTPNGDGVNDLFRPFPYCFVDGVDMTIVNRWGEVVFKTDDPDILWDGRHFSENKYISDGVYFYTCLVRQKSVFGQQEIELKGVVHLVGRNK
ncbi:MAG: gliding motility-associated C-terminal domain-containing protein [Vicingaceae bacterium]